MLLLPAAPTWPLPPLCLLPVSLPSRVAGAAAGPRGSEDADTPGQTGRRDERDDGGRDDVIGVGRELRIRCGSRQKGLE